MLLILHEFGNIVAIILIPCAIFFCEALTIIAGA